MNGSLNQSAVAAVEADYVDASGVKWGRLVTGSWVKLGDPRIGTLKETAEEQGVKVTVTGDYVNVRTGPGTNYPVVSGVVRGNVLNVTRVVSVNGTLWGLFRGGWLCLDYTNYSGGLTVEMPGDVPQIPNEPDNPTEPSDPETPDAVVATGVVTASQLNIRAAAGTNSGVVGAYNRGDKVQILQTATVAGTLWGRTDRGWICMTYVKLDEKKEEPETTVPSEPTVPETTEPEVTEPSVPETTVPPETQPEEKPDAAAGIPGTVTSKAGLLIRTGPGTQYNSIGAYISGQQIRILEQVTANGMAWGRTDKGWVSMQYVKLSEDWTAGSGIYGVITSASGLNVRSGPGVGYAPVAAYPAGARVVIFEQKSVSGQIWGRTDKGWISMAYVRLESAAEQQPEQTEPETTEPTVPETTVPDVTEPEDVVTGTAGTVVTGLNIRQTPGDGAIVGTYRRGDRIIILEKKLIHSTYWGRTDKGWVSLSYVDMDEGDDDSLSGRSGMITASVLCIRSGPGTGNGVVGTYTEGQTVIILETTRVGVTLWGRTDKGWICMDYVK